MRMTMKLGFAIALVAAMAFVAVPMAEAGVVNSNHDMSFKTAGSLKAGACSHCHIPHKAGGSKLWASNYSDAGTTWTSDTISQLCYTCHGNGTPGIALEQNPFAAGNHHGRTVGTLTGFGDIASLPGDVAVGADGNLKCTSCHDVHSNVKRPFLRWVSTAGFNFNENCAKCHPNRNGGALRGTANAIAGASQHPVQVALPTAAASTRAYFVATGGEFSIVPGTQVEGIAGTAGWNLGGHRNDALGTGQMGCVTCHAVHGDETNIYTSTTNGPTPVAAANLGFNHLNVRNGDPLTGAAAPYVAPLCTGCHANSATAGPGLTGTYTHPIQVTRNGATFIVPVASGYKWGGASNDMLVCQSCHKIHYGAPNTSLLYGTIDGPNPLTSNKNCGQCHIFATVNHHPNGATVVAAAGMVAATRSTGPMNWTTLTRTAGAATFPWGAGNTLLCSTCHYQSGAHNNAGPFNGLLSYNINSEICIDCHSTNPSQYTSMTGGHPGSSTITMDASHYIGNVITTSYKRLIPWSTTGLSSKWGSTGTGISANGAIICESCHTVSMQGTIPGPTFSANTVPPVAGRIRASVGLLLEVSGNNQTVFATGITSNTADLCTGCHGSSPQGGTSGGGSGIHPAISATPPMAGITDATLEAKIAAEFTARGTVSLTNGASGLINCESCHRPHDAANGSGALILEGCGTASNKTAGGANGTIFDRSTLNGGLRYAEEATFCNLCHSY